MASRSRSAVAPSGNDIAGTTNRYRLRQRGAPRVQAIPGVEQASPSGVRAQTTQLSVHSTQAGSGGPPSVVGCGPAPRPDDDGKDYDQQSDRKGEDDREAFVA